MSYAQVPRLPGAHRAGLVVVVALHALIGLALLQGLARTVIDSVPPPVDTRLIPELPKPQESLPKLPQPKAPQLPQPKAPQLPQRLAQLPDLADPAPTHGPTITVSRDAAPLAPDGSPTGDATAVVPQPVPPSPRPAARPAIVNVQACAPQGEDYPQAARRAEAAGTTRLRFTISAGGSLVRSEVVRSAGPTREHRLLDRVAESKLAGCSFTPGIDQDGNAVGATFEVDYVWRLE